MSVRSILFGPEAYEPPEPHHAVTDDADAIETLRRHGAIVITNIEALQALLTAVIEKGRYGDDSETIAYTASNQMRGLR